MDKLDIALNPNTPPETLDRLSYDKDYWVRRAAALNPNTSPETLDRLSYDEYSGVRYWVAHNRNTPPETLDRLSYDKDYWVRRMVAKHPNTPQYILDLFKFRRFLKWYKYDNHQEEMVYDVEEELTRLIEVQRDATQYEN
jgi:hypothetical protein